jgi:hypothetical protein
VFLLITFFERGEREREERSFHAASKVSDARKKKKKKKKKKKTCFNQKKKQTKQKREEESKNISSIFLFLWGSSSLH